MGRISSFVDRASTALCDFSGVMLVAMAMLINVEVVARYGFNTSTLIADEYGGYLFVWMTLLGFAHALRTGQFLRVEALVVKLGPGPRIPFLWAWPSAPPLRCISLDSLMDPGPQVRGL